MNLSSATVAPEVDEFALAGLTAAEGRIVEAPLVAESPVAFECRLSQIVPLVTADGVPMPNRLVIGEVVAVHIDRASIIDGLYVTAAAAPITRGGGPADYFEIGEAARFEMRRPD